MRMHTGDGGCSYGLNSQAGYLFERNRIARRQRIFERARGGPMGGPMKRKARDDDSDSSGDEWRPRGDGGFVMDGMKRMRVSSPPQSQAASGSGSGDAEMTDQEAATPRTTWRTDNTSLIPVAASNTSSSKKRPLFVAPATGSPVPRWKAMRSGDYQFSASNLSMGLPSDEACRAMVVFDPYKSIPRSPVPRIELVESDDSNDSNDERPTSPESDQEESFVRFEELPDDTDVPMELD